MKLIEVGCWGENITWELFEATTLPSEELCTAVMCVAVSDGKVVLARSERGWGMLGGHIEDGETLEQALYREAYEEGGFIIDKHQLFAVRKITAKNEIPHQRAGKTYPFPVSYIVYYWATTNQSFHPAIGEEIIESGSFSLNEIDALTSDYSIIKAGWEMYNFAILKK